MHLFRNTTSSSSAFFILSCLISSPHTLLLRSSSAQCASTLLVPRAPATASLSHSILPTKHVIATVASKLSQLTLPPRPRPGTRTGGLRLSAVARSLRPHNDNNNHTPPIAQRSIDSTYYCSEEERKSRLSCVTLICDRSTPRRVTACLTD